MSSDLKLGKLVIEGKTKKVYEIVGNNEECYIESKDRITAGDGAKAHDMIGKSVISTATTAGIFKYLNAIGIKTHFVKTHGEKAFIAKKCDMIPIEWICRRNATGSFLRRFDGVEEGYRFTPLKLETCFKDDENHDPVWTYEQLIGKKLCVGGMTLEKHDVDILLKTTACIFEVLEKAWNAFDCSLIDMKVEYGVTSKGELVLADVIDSDSWRLWPAGDKRLMVDKQVYRNLKEVTPEDLDRVKNNFKWTYEQVKKFIQHPNGRVVVVMGSTTDETYCRKIKASCDKLNIPCEMRIASAHKETDEALKIIAEYEGDNVPTVFVAVAGRSNGLGPVMSGNTSFPVINCPPISADWGREDVWSSLRMPSGLGCVTVLSPDGAALHAAEIFGLTNHLIWSSIRAQQLNIWLGLKNADKNLCKQQKE